jgi:O-6-methylguanine DNA methyltransferase
MGNVAAMLERRNSCAIAVTVVSSPIGEVLVASAGSGVCAVIFDDRAESLEPKLRRTFGHFFHLEAGDPLRVAARLRAYFSGELRALDAIPLAMAGTPMQRRVWDMVRALDPGQLTTYAALAERLGMPRAQRAVGVCLASNPVPLFIPCHRVVAASGGLGSHPGGIPRKRWLLGHEGVLNPGDARIARMVRHRLVPRERGEVERSERLVALAGG